MLTIAGGIVLAIGILALWITIFPIVEDTVGRALEWCMDVDRLHPIRRRSFKIIGVFLLLLAAEAFLYLIGIRPS